VRILVFQQAAWDDTNSVGNTLSNWFGEWDEDVFADFYTRKQTPNNHIVSEYYTVSAKDLINPILRKNRQKRRFKATDLHASMKDIEKQREAELKDIEKLHHMKNRNLTYWIVESIWRSKIWLDSEFKSFVSDFKPDILFAFGASTYMLDPLISFVKRELDTKVVLFIADDVYGQYKRQWYVRRRYLLKSYKNCMRKADLVYGASEEICQVYGNRFNRSVIPLYKGCEFTHTTPKAFNNPLRIVYAGNLLYGRDETLSRIADSLESINSLKLEAVLEIYTGTEISSEVERKLNRGASSRIMGKRPFSEIQTILSEADIVLHVESYDAKQIEVVKYSLSTKIIDCLESGSLVLGVGPDSVSSIMYIQRIPGAKCISDLNDLTNELVKLIHMSDEQKQNCINTIREYAAKNHSIHSVRKRLRTDFVSLMRTKKQN